MRAMASRGARNLKTSSFRIAAHLHTYKCIHVSGGKSGRASAWKLNFSLDGREQKMLRVAEPDAERA